MIVSSYLTITPLPFPPPIFCLHVSTFSSNPPNPSILVCIHDDRIKSSLFELIVSKEVEVSFGMTNIYLYRRNEKPHPSYQDDVEFLDSLGVFKR